LAIRRASVWTTLLLALILANTYEKGAVVALAIRFSPKSMSASQYDEVISRLEQAGAGAPDGRAYHVCYGAGNDLRVVDVWESSEKFEKFGETLMPILQELGVDPGEPEISEVHNIIKG
jgi:hypothetical protein